MEADGLKTVQSVSLRHRRDPEHKKRKLKGEWGQEPKSNKGRAERKSGDRVTNVGSQTMEGVKNEWA